MRLRKSIVISLLIAVFSLCGCNIDNTSLSSEDSSSNDNSSNSSLSTSNQDEIKTISGLIRVDYGLFSEGKTTLLFEDMLVPFNYKKYNIDYLAAGDFVEVTYTGEWYILDSYPATVSFNGEIKDVKVTHGRILEFEVAENPGGGTSLRILDSSITPGNYLTTYCINRNGTFDNLSNYPIGTKIYGINPANFDSLNILAFYSYNPSSLNESIELKEYFKWINDLKEEDIVKVISCSYHGSISPRLDILDEHCYSTNSSDFHLVYQYLNSTKIIYNNPDIVDGAGNKSLTIVTSNQEYTITTIANDLLITNSEYATISSTLPSFSLHYGYSFMPSALVNIKVKNMTDETDVSREFSNLGRLRSMIFEDLGDVDFPEEINSYNIYKFENSYGYFIFENSTDFCVYTSDGKYNAYRIINEITFDFLYGTK